ncbi:MAG: MBL fold metallo-hydrolase [Anaerovoracaceae bacterium]
MVVKRIITGFLMENGYIVHEKKGDSCYIIDPGLNSIEYKEYIDSNSLKVKGILLTHHHDDHMGGVADLKEVFLCPVFIGEQEGSFYGVKADFYIRDKEDLKLNGKSLKALLTKGHTAGSLCFFAEAERLCFTGDTVFNVDLGRTDLKGGSYEDMKNSIINIVDKWDDSTEIYPGHGDPCSMEFVRGNNFEYIHILKEGKRREGINEENQAGGFRS